MKNLLLLLFLLVASPHVRATDFDYSSYHDSSIAATGPNLRIDPQTTYWLDAAHSKINAAVTFTGKVRPIQPDTRALIESWAKAMRHGPAVAAMYTSEIEVDEQGATYWLPVQQALIDPLQREIAPGKRVRLYLMLIGAYKRVPVLAINEFSAVEN